MKTRRILSCLEILVEKLNHKQKHYAFGILVENSDELVRLNGGIPSGNKTAEKIEVQDYAFILVMNDRGFPLLFLKLFLFSLTPKVRILIEGGCKKKRAFLLFCEVLFRL